MKQYFFIPLLSIIIFSVCSCQDVESDRTHEIVEEAKNVVASQEFQSEQRQIQSAEIRTAELVKRIDNSGSVEIIKSKEIVLATCDSLKIILSNSEQLLNSKHGVDKNGKLKNNSENAHVNTIFIEEGYGNLIKELCISSEKKLLSIVTNLNLDIKTDEIPLRLNLFMEKKGQKWEDYIFHNMPAIAVLPILDQLHNNVILTQLLILEKLNENIQ